MNLGVSFSAYLNINFYCDIRNKGCQRVKIKQKNGEKACWLKKEISAHNP